MSSRSLTLAEARRRIDQVESPSYDVHLDLTAPATYVARYAELGPELATLSSAFANVVGWGFPRLALDAEQLETFERALQGDVPTLLRRAWEDELDDRR